MPSRFGGWSFTVSSGEFRELCEGGREGGSLEYFLGSMSLFLYFTVFASKIMSNQVPMVCAVVFSGHNFCSASQIIIIFRYSESPEKVLSDGMFNSKL